MKNLTIHMEEAAAFTAVSNCFIDHYMTSANDAQLKVYLYLLRMFQADQATSVSDMADLFNHTEKDILRALKYWEKQKLLTLEYDGAKNLSAIHLFHAHTEDNAAPLPASEAQARPVQSADIVSLSSVKQLSANASAAPLSASAPASAQPENALPEKPSYSLDDLKAFRNNEETGQLLFIVEQYIGKPLSPSEIKTVFFIYDKLHFSCELIDYLFEYCVGRDKRDFRYIEKVALSWAEDHITTPKQAKSLARKYDKTVYSVMKSLGKNGNPTPKEASYVMRWTKELGFTLPVIEVACERTVMATDKHRFEYADSILASWNRSHVHNLEDIQTADAAYQKSKPAQSRSSMTNNPFNQFPQRDYDFDMLEKELLSN